MINRAEHSHGGLPEPASELPHGLEPYKRTPEFNEDTIPAGLLKAHATKDGVWGRICVVSGELVYTVTDGRRQARALVLSPGHEGIVEPTILHHVRAIGPVGFFVEFLRGHVCGLENDRSGLSISARRRS